ncbi:MAG TPA: class I SAM-dependent rRNA methyltransferase [Gemmatales bacterium]|nr:class I SAM-dependent rRNA methyltransferase [Gemmatales bacterium]
MDNLPVIRLKIERRSSHPWIFQKMVEKPMQKPPPGTVVDVEDLTGAWVGRGLYNGHSRISLRILTSNRDEVIDAGFFRRKLEAAVALRRDIHQLDKVTNAYRLVHSEGDGLSGLVVDRFADILVLEFFSAGMWKWRETIKEVLSVHYPGSRFYWFAEEHVQKQESFDCWPPEAPSPGTITEHGMRFRVQPGSRHKTGFFVDQRDNRNYLTQFTPGKRVLDICCNSGGFAVYAKAKGQAEESIGIDLDEECLETAKENANLNQCRVKFVQTDLFPWLRDSIARQQLFDVVILDPAKQTREREGIDEALKKYLDMNRLAMQVVAPGGIYLTCSCTGLINEDLFIDCVRRAAWQAGRTLQVFHLSGAGPDHPWLGHVREGRYLKAVWGRLW